MCGCREQKYSYAPGVVNVNENLSPVSSAFDLNSLAFEATVCGISSSLVQVTVVPAFTVMPCGAKVKLSIFTSVSAACVSAACLSGACVCAACAAAAGRTAAAARIATATAMQALRAIVVVVNG